MPNACKYVIYVKKTCRVTICFNTAGYPWNTAGHCRFSKNTF